MRNPSELSREEFESIAEQVRDILGRDFDTKEFDPEKEWRIETIEWVSGVLEDAGLKPEDPPTPPADPGPAPDANSPGPCQDASDRPDPGASPMAAMRSALVDFIQTIEATGGCIRNADGLVAPAGDPDWTDLGEAFVRACTAIGRTPLIAGTEDEEEIEEV